MRTGLRDGRAGEGKADLYARSDDLVRVRNSDRQSLRRPRREDVLCIRLRKRPDHQRRPLLTTKKRSLTSISCSGPHVSPFFSSRARFRSDRRFLISSYAANWMEPFVTPTRARREPL